MTRPSEKAERYLAEGRVAVTSVTTSRAEFTVRGSGPDPYRVIFRGSWSCDCPARVSPCAHVLACQKVFKAEPVQTVLEVHGDDELSAFIAAALRS